MNTPNHIGRSVGRYLRTLGIGEGDSSAAVAYAESQPWLEKSAVVDVFKAGVGALRTTDVPDSTVLGDFLAALRPYAVLSRLDKVRKVPARTTMIAFGAGAIAYRIGQRKNIPISRAQLLGVSVEPIAKVAAITVATKETLAMPGASIDIALGQDLAAAVGAAEDLAFLDPLEPGSILNGAPTAQSATPDTTEVPNGLAIEGVDEDLQRAIELLLAAGGKLRDAAWIMSAEAAVKVAGMRGSGGALAFPGLGVNGGELLSLPVVVSEQAHGFLALVDQSGILVDKDAGIEVQLSENTMLQMVEDPTDPPDLPDHLVSIFQTECVAFKAVIYRGWKARAGAGVYVEGGFW